MDNVYEESLQELFEKARKLRLEPSTFGLVKLEDRCYWPMPLISDKKVLLKGEHPIQAHFSNYRSSNILISDLGVVDVRPILDEYVHKVENSTREHILPYDRAWVKLTAKPKGYDCLNEVWGVKDSLKAVLEHHPPYLLELRFGNSLDAIDFVDEVITPKELQEQKRELPPYLRVVK